MRVLFLNPTGQTGGAETALVEMLAGLREAQPSWPLTLLIASDGPLADRARTLGVSVLVLSFPAALAAVGEWGRRGGFWPRLQLAASLARAAWPTHAYLRRLRREMARLAPNIVHTNGLKMHVLGAWARPRDAAVVWHMHDYVGSRPLTARLLRRAAPACAAVIANSESVAADVRGVCGPGPTVHAIWNAVDLDRFSPHGPKLDLDTLAGLPPLGGVVRVGLLATFARWKGHQTFLRALGALPPSMAVRGYVIGGPVYDTAGSQVSIEELRAEADALGLGSRVGFTGFVQNPAPAIRALDVVVHASTEPEPFGLVIAEAMACGRAVIVSEAGGAAELVVPGVDAVTHRPGDAAELADRIGKLVTDAAARQRLGLAGRAAAERSFGRGRMTSALLKVYRDLATSPGSPEWPSGPARQTVDTSLQG